MVDWPSPLSSSKHLLNIGNHQEERESGQDLLHVDPNGEVQIRPCLSILSTLLVTLQALQPNLHFFWTWSSFVPFLLVAILPSHLCFLDQYLISWERNNTCGSKFRDSKTADLWLWLGTLSRIPAFTSTTHSLILGAGSKSTENGIKICSCSSLPLFWKTGRSSCNSTWWGIRNAWISRTNSSAIRDSKTTSLLKSSTAYLKDLPCKRCYHKHILEGHLLSCRPFWLNFEGVQLHSHVKGHSPEDFPAYIVQSDTSQVLRLVLVLAHVHCSCNCAELHRKNSTTEEMNGITAHLNSIITELNCITEVEDRKLNRSSNWL